MGLTQARVEAIKQKAVGKNVIILLGEGGTVFGKLIEVATDYIKLESTEDTTYLTIDSIKALRIRK